MVKCDDENEKGMVFAFCAGYIRLVTEECFNCPPLTLVKCAEHEQRYMMQFTGSEVVQTGHVSFDDVMAASVKDTRMHGVTWYMKLVLRSSQIM